MILYVALFLSLLSAIILILGKFTFRQCQHQKFPPKISLIRLLLDVLKGKEGNFGVYADFKRNYGDVFHLNVFGYRVVVFNDLNLAKTCFSNPDCCGAASFPIFKKIKEVRSQKAFAGEGIVLADFEVASEQRKFFLKTFADLGRKSGSWKEQLNLEVSLLMNDLHDRNGEAFCVTRYFAPFFCKATWRALGNETLDDGIITAIFDAMEATTKFSTITQVLGIWLPDLVSKFSHSWRCRLDTVVRPPSMLREEIARQAKSRVPEAPRHFIDAYLDEIDRSSNISSSFHASKLNIHATLTDVLFGALETTSATLEWFLVHLLRNPQIQEKLQREVDGAVGRNRLPTLDDRPQLPFTEACIWETLRLEPIIPLTFLRLVKKDVEINGYFLRKGTLVTKNTVAINRNPEVWESPKEFLPERFISPTGQFMGEKRKLISTFNVGLRVCIGQQIALDSLFVFIASIVQNFHVTAEEIPPLIPLLGVVSPPELKVKIAFKPRE